MRVAVDRDAMPPKGNRCHRWHIYIGQLGYPELTTWPFGFAFISYDAPHVSGSKYVLADQEACSHFMPLAGSCEMRLNNHSSH